MYLEQILNTKEFLLHYFTLIHTYGITLVHVLEAPPWVTIVTLQTNMSLADWSQNLDTYFRDR